MKIILHTREDGRETHAADLVRRIEAFERNPRHNPKDAKPVGIAHHLTHYAIRCDDCGTTYWAKDEYSSHIGCKGAPSGLGF